MTSEQISIPEGTQVSFIDPVTQRPVRGVVRLEFKKFVGVHYEGTNEPAESGNLVHKLKDGKGRFFAFVTIDKSKVFVVR
jgi:hypothetical protein